MSWLGNVTTSFAKWATDQISSLVSRVTVVEGKQIFTKKFISAQQTITAAGQLVIPHGLGVVPELVTATLVCITAEQGYAVGARIPAQVTQVATSALDNKGGSIQLDTTNLTVRFGNAGGASNYDTVHATTGAAVGLSNANWQIIYKAYA